MKILSTYPRNIRRLSPALLGLYLSSALLALGSDQLNLNRSLFWGDPINMKTLSFVFDTPLFDLGGPASPCFGLRYDSNSTFQDGWGDTLPGIVRPYPGTVYVEHMDKGSAVWNFENTEWDGSGDWVAGTYSMYRYSLQEEPGANGWFYLMDPAEACVYIFEKNGDDDDSYDQEARLNSRMDRNGNTLTYTYQAWDSITNISDGLGRELSFHYWNGHLVAVSNGLRAFHMTYNEYDNPISLVDPNGGTNLYEYRSASSVNLTRWVKPEGNCPYAQDYVDDYTGQVTTQVDAYGNATVLSVEHHAYPEPDVVVETRPDGRSNLFVHALFGACPAEITDADGQSAVFTSDDYDRPTGVTDRLGGTTTMGYHEPTGFLSTITNAQGHVLQYTFSPQSQSFTNPANSHVFSFTFYVRTRIDYPDATAQLFDYDERGNLTNITDRSGARWNLTCNAQGRPITITNPSGGVITNTYNSDGTLASRADSDLGVEVYTYDSYKRMSTVDPPGPGTLRIEYDLMDRVTALIDENSRTNRFEYDRNGNLIAAVDPAGHCVSYTYDLMDRLVSTSNRLGGVSTMAYDALNGLTNHTDEAGLSTTLLMDSRQRLAGITRHGNTLLIERNEEGLAIGHTTPAGRSDSLTRNALGEVTGSASANGAEQLLQRDAMTRITNRIDALNRSIRYVYDDSGRLTGVEQPGMPATIYTRNEAGLLTKIQDSQGSDWTFDYTPMGRLAATTDPLGRTNVIEHDSRGRVATVTYADSSTEQRTYDATGLLTNLVFSDGTQITYTYDALGLITETAGLVFTRDARGRILSDTSYGFTLDTEYDAVGRVTNLNYNGAFQVAYQYDENGRLQQVSDTLGNRVTFAYDPDGLVTNTSRGNGTSAAYQNDSTARLTALQDEGPIDLTYAWDAAGQFAGIQGAIPLNPADYLSSTQDTINVDAAGQVSNTGYSYDDLGRATALPGHTLSWDGASRVTHINDAAFTYNGLHEIATRSEEGTTNTFHHLHTFAGHPVAAERLGTTATRYYVYKPNGRLLYSLDPADSYAVTYYHADHLGSVLALTDASGAVTDRYAYDADGRLLAHEGSSDQPYTYIGTLGVRREGDLYQMYHRVYDPHTARFLSREPLWPQLQNPDLLNPYLYALGQPLRFIDPDGLNPYLSDAELDAIEDKPEPGIVSQEAATTLFGTKEQFLKASFEVYSEKWANMLGLYAGPNLPSYMAALKVAWQRNPDISNMVDHIVPALLKQAKADFDQRELADTALDVILGKNPVRAESYGMTGGVRICALPSLMPDGDPGPTADDSHDIRSVTPLDMVIQQLLYFSNPAIVQRAMLGGLFYE